MVTLAFSSCGAPDDPVVTANDESASIFARCDALRELAEFNGDAGVVGAGVGAEEALQAIHAQIDDPEPRIVRCAAAALRDFQTDSPSETARLLNPLLRDPNPVVVTAVAKALGNPDDPPGNARSVKQLERVAVKGLSGEGADKRWAEARAAAVLALGALGDRHAEGIMLRMLRNEPREADAAALALVRLFSDDVGHLLPLLDDRRNWRLVYPLVDVRSAGCDAALIAVLDRSDNPTMAEYYVNHGDRRLRQAANRWAEAHGYWFGVTPAQVG